MSCIDQLQQAIVADMREVVVRGVTLYLAPVSAKAALSLHRQFTSLPKDENGHANDDDGLMAFYVSMVSKCLVEPDTMQRTFDSDYGRGMLESLGLDLLKLGEAAGDMIGLTVRAVEDAKKN